MKRWTIVWAGLFLVFSLFAGPSLGAEKEFQVGCNFMLSGPAAFIGIATKQAVDHAAEVINEKGFMVQGEKYKVKPVYYDSKYVPAEALLNLEKMLAGGIRFVFSQGSGVTVPLVEKTTAAKVLMMASCSGSFHLTSPKYPYSFRSLPCNEAAFALYPWLAKEYPQIKRVAQVNPSDEAGYTESETRVRCAKNVGMENVANEYFKRGATDFYPVATRVLATKPDLIDTGGTAGRDQSLLAKALREVGYKGLLAVSYSDPGGLIKVVGEGAEGILLPNTVSEPQNPKQQALHDWYIQKYGPPVSGILYEMYDPLFVLVEAVKKADSLDPVKVSEAFRTIQWDSVLGPLYVGMEAVYGIKCTFCRPVPMGVIKDGKLKHLATLPWPSDAEIARLNKE